MFCPNCGVQIEEESPKSKKRLILTVVLSVIMLASCVCLFVQVLRGREYTRSISALEAQKDELEEERRYYKVELPYQEEDRAKMAEMVNAVTIACSIEEVFRSLSFPDSVIIRDGSVEIATKELEKELKKTIDFDSIVFKSKHYSNKTYTISILRDKYRGTVHIEGSWSDEPDSSGDPSAAGTD